MFSLPLRFATENRRRNRTPDIQPQSRQSAAINRLHPDLLDLLSRTNTLPPGDLTSIPENDIAHAVSVALSLADDFEQAQLVSRIMTDAELAIQRLGRPDVQDLGQRMLFNAEERRLILSASPETEDAPVGRHSETCIVCGETGTEILRCECAWCPSCIREGIRTGLRSELSFPPRCCQRFNEATVRLARHPALMHLFRQLSAEFGTPAAERVHCHDASCGAFIPDARPFRRGVVTCELCGAGTCPACGARAHPGLPCTEESEEEVWKMMDDNGLVGCPACGLVMSLRDGCNHMTCLCRAEFCYICGRRWNPHNECKCPMYGGLDRRVAIRNRPGRKPIARGRAYLVAQEDDLQRIPQLRDGVVPGDGDPDPAREWVHDLPALRAAPPAGMATASREVIPLAPAGRGHATGVTAVSPQVAPANGDDGLGPRIAEVVANWDLVPLAQRPREQQLAWMREFIQALRADEDREHRAPHGDIRAMIRSYDGGRPPWTQQIRRRDNRRNGRHNGRRGHRSPSWVREMRNQMEGVRNGARGHTRDRPRRPSWIQQILHPNRSSPRGRGRNRGNRNRSCSCSCSDFNSRSRSFSCSDTGSENWDYGNDNRGPYPVNSSLLRFERLMYGRSGMALRRNENSWLTDRFQRARQELSRIMTADISPREFNRMLREAARRNPVFPTVMAAWEVHDAEVPRRNRARHRNRRVLRERRGHRNRCH